MVLVSLFPSITSQDSFEFEVTSDVGCGGIAYFSSSLSQSLLITRPSTHCSSKEIHGSHLHPQFEDYKESNRSGRTLISISGLFVWTLQLDKGDEMQDMLHEAFGIPPTSFVDMEEIGSMSMPQPPQNWPQNERDESHDTKNLPDSEQQKQQIRSMSMPQPPQNWPQNERDESHDTENLLDSNESEEQSKQTRGPTMMHSGWGKDGGNLHIELNEHGQVIGSEGTRLSSKLGVLARNGIFAPLNHKDWRLVPSTYKDRIWAHIKENTNATDDMKCILMMSFGSKWKKSKYEAKTIGYDPYNTDIERLAHCPDRVEEDQWRSLVHYWSSKEAKKQMDDLAEVYPELNVPGSAPNDVYSQVMGSDTHGIVRTLGKGASPSLVYGPVYKRSQTEKRDFDTRVEIEVQKATSAMKIEMTEKMYEAKKEMEAMDKKRLEAKEEAKENNEVMERKLSEAKMDMEEIIADKVKEGIQAYVESLGINIDANLKSEQVPDNPLKDCQQPSSLVPGVHTRKANMIKKTGTTVIGTNKNKWNFQGN